LYQIGYACAVRKVVPVVLVLAALIAWWKWPREGPAQKSLDSPAAVAATKPEIAVPKPVTRRLDPEERKQLGAKIKAAIEKARVDRLSVASTAPGPHVADDPVIPLESVGAPLKAGLDASIPLLAACYEKAGSASVKTAAANMTMVSDPDLGTVIDTATVTDAEGKPLAPELDTCLRDTIDQLELPPLGQVGKLNVQYTFRFD
jgi:hypothetical protein